MSVKAIKTYYKGYLFRSHFLKPGYIRQLAGFHNLYGFSKAAGIARAASFEHGGSHAR